MSLPIWILIWAGVMLAGGAGAVLRFYVDAIVSAAAGRDFPYGTLLVNISGAVVLGLLSGLALSSGAALVAGTGVIGSYTTFSTWMLETQRLAEERQHRKVIANVAVSLVLGVAAAALGRLIGAHL
jgi:CrcB protein